MHPQRRTYSKSFKAQVIHECSKPGACIANIALGYSLNANLATSGFGCTIKMNRPWFRRHLQAS